MTRQFEVQAANALVHATEDQFNCIILVADFEDSRLVDRFAHLLGATRSAVATALEAAGEYCDELCRRPSTTALSAHRPKA